MFGQGFDHVVDLFMDLLRNLTLILDLILSNLNRLRQSLLTHERPHDSLRRQAYRLQIIPPLKHNKQRLAKLHQPLRHIVIPIRRNSEATQRIPPGRIEPTRNKNKIRLELFQYGFDDTIVQVDVLVVAGGLEGVFVEFLVDVV